MFILDRRQRALGRYLYAETLGVLLDGPGPREAAGGRRDRLRGTPQRLGDQP
jgi:hypothetical protein